MRLPGNREIGGVRTLLRQPDIGEALAIAAGRAVLPGLVDAHTHLVFAGERAEEFAARLRGVGYEEALAAGGGINRTVRETRAASDEELEAAAATRLATALRYGTTTLEAKSGYGLTVDDERRSLEVLGRLAARSPVEVVPTSNAVPKQAAITPNTRRGARRRKANGTLAPRASR